jgi:tellurite methyltransferase
MEPFTIQQLTGNTDIYLLDQIMKGRYRAKDLVLDAGCGIGRNLHWFYFNNIDCYGIDLDPLAIEQVQLQYPTIPADRLLVSTVENTPFKDCFFDHIISSAVLHFAANYQQFDAMIQEMVRVLKPAGTLFIRMTSSIGIENRIVPIGDGVYNIPDGSTRFLLTRKMIDDLLNNYPIALIEEVKTVNVNDIRCMTTLVFKKAD